jgi:hypothetical protein
MTWLARAVFAAASVCAGVVPVASAANIIRNAGFEDVTGAVHVQGYLPNEWFQVGYPNMGADTYSNDGSWGLSPSAYGNFTGVTAQAGLRFVAGSSGGFPESIGQTLTNPLAPGASYELSGWLHRGMRYDLQGAANYYVYLAESSASNATKVLVATLGPTVGSQSSSPQWEEKTAAFVAPASSASLPVIVFEPLSAQAGYYAYPGLDNVSLNLVPEPASLSLLTLGGLALIRRRRA